MSHVSSCKECGKQTEYKYKSAARKYCSYACSNKAKWATRPRAKSVTLSCGSCGEGFSLNASVLEKRRKHIGEPKYCSKACSAIAARKPDCRAIVACSHCGAATEKRVDHIGEKNFCSVDCHSKSKITAGSIWSEAGPLTDEQIAMRRDYMRGYTAKNRETLNKQSREWAKKNRSYRNFIQQMRRAAGEITYEEWKKVIDDSGGCCGHCGSEDSLEVDHILAVSKGGKTEPLNLQVLCKPCNISKGDGWIPKTPGIVFYVGCE